MNVRRRLPAAGAARLAMTAALLTGGVAGTLFLGMAPASATPCGSAVAAGSSCTLTGTFTLGGGSLTLTSPSSLSWSASVTGLDQQVVDTQLADQQYVVDDATGTGAGWHVTVSATTFTDSSSDTLPNLGTFATNGSSSSMGSSTAPTAACTGGGTCTLPTNTTTYPVAITTAASSPTAVTIYDTSASTGLGSITIGSGSNPVGWWLNVPSNTRVGTYTSTITLQITSAP